MDKFIPLLQKFTSSKILRSYTGFWIAYHWEGIITLLFTNQDLIYEKYNMLKNEYLAKYFFGLVYNNEWQISSLLWKIGGFVIPAILAYIYVWWLPKFVLNPSYKKDIQYRTDRRIIKNNEEKRLSESERAKTEATVKETDAKIELQQKKEKVKELSSEEIWTEEFETLLEKRPNTLFKALASLQFIIYEKSGWIKSNDTSYISSSNLAFCDVNQLITFDTNSKRLISLTEKGRVFMKNYIDLTSQNINNEEL